MLSLDDRVDRLEKKSRRSLILTGLACLAIGAWLGAAADPTSKTLIASNLIIVDEDGRPVIDLIGSNEMGGRIHVRDSAGIAGLVLSAGEGGGVVNVFDAKGKRLIRLGDSPTGDGMLLLSGADSEPLVRAGRWSAAEGASVWTASSSEPSTP